MKAPRAFTSLLAPDMVRYLTVKHALGRQYDGVSRVLAHIDHFLMTRDGELTPATFAGWILTLEHLASGTRRRRMQVVRNFCLYRRRDLPAAFVPDERLFRPSIRSFGPISSRRRRCFAFWTFSPRCLPRPRHRCGAKTFTWRS